jgi:RNA polymerase sigma-70 factor (ECF subfamily)
MAKMDEEELELVRRAQSGDDQALNVLLERLIPVVVNRARRLGGPRIAEDAAQDTLWQVTTHIAELRDPLAFRGWLHQIIRRVVDRHRKRAWVARWVGALEHDVSDWSRLPEREVEKRKCAELVESILERIPKPQREVLVLAKVEGHTLPEVAALVGVAEGTARSRLRLAIERFTLHAKRLGLEPDLSPLYETEVAS